MRERMVGTQDPLFTVIAEVDHENGRVMVGLLTAQMTRTRGA